jgi:hypothetical protein
MEMKIGLIVLGAVAMVGFIYWLGKATEGKDENESET